MSWMRDSRIVDEPFTLWATGDAMRTASQGTELKAVAYAGTYVVVMGWDTLDGKKPGHNAFWGMESSERNST